jgi:tetratricopeptide (TPR) repeat protein
MGTIASMSPEQARGEELDARTDLFSFGAVLYEMATGRMAFTGNTAAIVHEAILNRAPAPVSRLNPELPPKLAEVIGKALEKDRKLRYQSAADIRTDLQRLKRDTESGRLPAASGGVAGVVEQRGIWGKVVVLAAAVILSVAACGYFYFHRTPKLTDKDTIVLADFTNTTGDPVFDGTLRQGLAIQLGQSPFLSLVSDKKIQDTLKFMGRSATDRLTPEVVRELCERVGSTAYLTGSVASLGSQFVLSLRAVSCGTGDVLSEGQAQATRKEDVLKALDKTAIELRGRLGESLSTVEKYKIPLAEATTSSLEALKAYSSGLEVVREKGSAAAVPLLKRAVEIDPHFAGAYAMLGRLYGDIGEPGIASENIRKAYELRGRTSEWEKFLISTSYHIQVTGNLQKAEQTCTFWAQAYPRSDMPHLLLSGPIYPPLGRYEEAAREAIEAIRINADFPIAYGNLANVYLALNRFDDAKSTLQRALERKLDSPYLHFALYNVAFAQSDVEGMTKEAKESTANTGEEDVLLSLEANTAAYFGRIEEARKLTRRATASAERIDEKETAASYEVAAAIREGLFGNAAEANKMASAGLTRSIGREILYDAALALAFAKNTPRGQTLADDLAKRFPEDSAVQFNYLPTLLAELALKRSEPLHAIELLEAAAPYERGSSSAIMYPVYVRGQAYLRAGRGREAGVEFQKILDSSGIVLNDPIGALAHLGLARAYAMQGDTAKAKAAYQDFLTLWKDADPDIPILKEAKSEYAKLK